MFRTTSALRETEQPLWWVPVHSGLQQQKLRVTWQSYLLVRPGQSSEILSVCLQLNTYTVREIIVCRELGCSYLLLLCLFLYKDSWLFQRQKLGRAVMKRRESGCSEVIQVFSVPLPPGLCRDRRWAFRGLARWRGSWGRDVTSVGQPGNTVETILFTE